MLRFLLLLFGILAFVSGTACAQTKPAPDTPPSATDKPADKKPADKKAADKKTPGAVITMEKGGEIRIEFYPADAPKTVENFIKLAGDGFYNGTTFHRVEPNFVIQGGDPLSKTLPQGDPNLGTGDPGYKIKAEFNKQKHDRGAVAMARSQHPDSAGSQFYITLGNANFLDGKYTVFGRVTSGMDVVDRVRPGDRMKSVTIVNR
jgi:peptidyl-prolyl cis-trans isomerase B (cyclophilin B)